MKYLLAIGILASFHIVTAQEGEPVLKGTTEFFLSEKNLDSMFGYGLTISSIELADCDGAMGEEIVPTVITDFSRTDSTMTVSFQFEAICGQDFLCEMEVVDNKILNLIYHGYGSAAFCPCCFGLTYHIDVDKEWGDEQVEIEYVMVNVWKATKVPVSKFED